MEQALTRQHGHQDDTRLEAILESVLFASAEPMTLRRLTEILNGPAPAEVRLALAGVAARCAARDRGVRLVEVAGGYQLRTARENAEWVRAVFRDRPRRLGRAALETVAIISYRQPITRADIEAIRGVDIDAVLSTLLQRGLIKVCGRKETVGRPLLYATTDAFLELFGLRDLSELPTLKELPAADGRLDEPAPAEVGGSTPPEADEPSRHSVAPESGGTHPCREGPGERPRGDGAGDAGGSAAGSD